jgi:hypothetical protein
MQPKFTNASIALVVWLIKLWERAPAATDKSLSVPFPMRGQVLVQKR